MDSSTDGRTERKGISSMRFISSLSVDRSNRRPSALWGDDPNQSQPGELQRIIVVVSTKSDSQGTVIAYGVNPDKVNPNEDQLVFVRLVPKASLGTFLKLVIEVDPTGDLLAQGATTAAVEVPVEPPPHTGPKLQVVFAYAHSLHTDDVLAQLSASAA